MAPRPEDVQKAVAQLQAELTATAPEIAKILSEPLVGEPATIHLFSDSVPAVVVKVNAKSVVVRRVEVDESTRRRFNDEREPYPAWAWDGDLSKPVGEPERYSLIGRRADGSPIYRNGSIGLSLGRSVKITDYRY